MVRRIKKQGWYGSDYSIMTELFRIDEYAQVLYRDSHLIVCNKNPGITVIPERWSTDGRVSLRERLEQVTGAKVYVIHRIDRATSGVILFSRTADVHRMLNRQFERRLVHKEYLALVQGVVAGPMVIDAPLRQFGSGRMGVHPEGKPSRTDVVVVERYNGATLVKVLPKTGRRHQIRVHLFHSGHPVMGDCLYGRDRPVGGTGRMMLHAASITCTYPEGEQFHIEAPVDTLWEQCIGNFRLSDAP